MTASGDDSITPRWTPEEQSIIDLVARTRGRQFAEENAEPILAEARAFGELPVTQGPPESL